MNDNDRIQMRVINPIKNIDFESSQKRICVSFGFVYLLIKNNLFKFDMNSHPYKWIKIPFTPFSERLGQSMTSIMNNIAFFGGKSKSPNKKGTFFYYNDLWILSNEEWKCLSFLIPPRAFHAAASDTKGNLIIHGGISETSIFSDFYIINVKETKFQKIELDLSFSNHLLYALPNNIIAIFGGNNDKNEENSTLFLVNIENNHIEKFDVPFHFKRTGVLHGDYCFDLLFVSGYDVILMYEFNHNVWLPLNLSSDPSLRPYFVHHIGNANELMIIDNPATALMKYEILSNPNMKFHQNHPDYVRFIGSSINYLPKYLSSKAEIKKQINEIEKEIKINRKTLSELIQNNVKDISKTHIDQYYKLQDLDLKTQFELNHINAIYKSLKNRIIENTKNEYKNDFIEDKNDFETVMSLFENHKKKRNHLSQLNIQAEKLENEINLLTFYFDTKNINSNNRIYKSQLEYENSLILSRQIAEKIHVLKNQLSELQKTYTIKREKHRSTKTFLMTNYIQLLRIMDHDKYQNSQIFSNKMEYLTTINDLFRNCKHIFDPHKSNLFISSQIDLLEWKGREIKNQINKNVKELYQINVNEQTTIQNNEQNINYLLDNTNQLISSLLEWAKLSNSYLPSNIRRDLSIFGIDDSKNRENKIEMNGGFRLIMRDWESFVNDHFPVVDLLS